jgi:hypothetical protein
MSQFYRKMPDNIEFDVFRSLPVNLDIKDKYLFEGSTRFRITPSKRMLLRNVFILWQGQVFKNGRVVAASLCTTLFLKKYSPLFFLSCFLKSIVKRNFFRLKASPYLILHDEWSGNYFHWLTDVLTRLYSVRDVLDDYTLILPENFCHSYNRYTLEKFGVKKIQWTNDKKMLFASEVLLPTHTAPAGNYNPELLRKAVQFLVSEQSRSLEKGDKIYITRQKASTRKVINEDEVISFLQRHGFAILHCEDLSFESQISILSHARVLISIHGAGLANLMFMPPESCVLELRKDGGPEMYNCYFALAAVFHQRYFYQGCESDSDLSVHDANIYVDINKLETILALMI